MEDILERLLAGWIWHVLIAIMAAGAGFVISFLLHRPQLKALKERLSDLEAAREESARVVPQNGEAESATVDFIGACAIIDAYIHPAMRDMRDITRLSVRRDFMDRFDKLTGAKLGEYEYNAKLLHQWMQSNAARFLIENRADMS